MCSMIMIMNSLLMYGNVCMILFTHTLIDKKVLDYIPIYIYYSYENTTSTVFL